MLQTIQSAGSKLMAFVGPTQSGDAGPLGTNGVPNTLIRTNDFSSVLGTIILWILGIAGSLAVLVLIIGGVMYITAAGDQTRIDLAKKTIKGAIIGVVFILLSAVIVFSLGFLFRA